ncbi:conserved hypothetical protein TIGR00096 [Luminiphilus syltensis NOR5-1B]|uniref:Ribosomal RNA small subunit methyltransferase I n=1 Tax=Luminiphilus syltensis NOR5-1B TaxID=565045 RepID=B8KR61_9GAMM|nr:16S rRNA (cytidine(1402)-2'-O)-methyltransferase [Luminiphilus syltensis]EED35523.1 conserved hypothetical protein TIGR00096 [Luminiphilus syltensis NOR5-1B]
MESGLYIVPTPIGNLEDLSLRARSVLETVDVIAAEDTRHSGTLLRHYDIDTPMISYHEHSTAQTTQELCDRMRSGAAIALISDAGTPLVSDPGYRLVRAAQDADVPVVPLPGPCAAVTALSAGGLPTDRFHFEGFLPNKASGRRKRLQALLSVEATLVFYEAPHRILATLQDAGEILGEAREATLVRELTKTFETVRRLPLAQLAQWVASDTNQQRGEIVLLISGAEAAGEVDAEARRLLALLAKALPPRKAASITGEFFGIRGRALYDELLRQKE